MKWDASAERILAILALQQHPELKVDVQQIVDKWPGEEQPTFRATYDRLRSLRKLNLNSSTDTVLSTTVTPAVRTPTPKTTKSSTKRKANTSDDAVANARGSNSNAFQRRLSDRRHGVTPNKRAKKIHKQGDDTDTDGVIVINGDDVDKNGEDDEEDDEEE